MQIETSQDNNYQPKGYKKLVVVLVIVLSFFLGWKYGRAGQDLSVDSLGKFITRNQDNAPKDVNWQLLWDSIKIINEKYVNRPADMQKVLYGAVSGAVNSLDDPYSVFLPPQDAKQFKDELSGNLEGIGAEIAIKHERLTVVTPIDGSPALKAGVKAGDFIYKVDGTDTKGLTVEQAVGKIRGKAGTQVKLTVFHSGATAPVDIIITRAQIVVQSVSWEIKNVNNKKIGYVKLRRFGDDTSDLLTAAITDFLKNGVRGVVFDVRNNPGGLLDEAVTVASNWVKQGDTVVIQKFGDGQETVYKGEGNPRLAKMPTVVLMNGGSASASEIVAGALHDHGFAKLIGEKSFGKGSVQELIDLSDKAQIKLTIAKWLTPAGHDLNHDGLEPDIKVELKDADFQADKDPQLEKALEVLAGSR